MNTVALSQGLPLQGFPQAFQNPLQGLNDASRSGVQSYEALSYSASSSVEVSISSKGMQLAYQSQSSVSYFSSNVQEVARPAPAQSMHSPEKSAETILNFIEQRVSSLAEAGASQEELKEALDQGLAGFQKGRDEAIDILKGYGFYEGPVEEGVNKTTELLEKGIEELRETYLVGENPSTKADQPATEKAATPVSPTVSSMDSSTDAKAVPSSDVQSLRSRAASNADSVVVAAYRERFLASESVDLSIETRDGDKINLSFISMLMQQREGATGALYRNTDDDGSSARQLGIAAFQQNSSSYAASFELSVQGDLDEDELVAIQDLISQISTLADKFFSGDMAQAFEKAMALDMDMDELASMSLSLSQTQVVQAERAYQSVSDLGPDRHVQHENPMKGLGHYNQGLLDILQKAEAYSQTRELVSELFATSFARLDAEQGEFRGEWLQESHNRLLDALELHHSAVS